MSAHVKRLIIIWSVGLVVGTAIIGITSPLFVRSYLSEQFDSARGRFVPTPASSFRWRSEGYATTLIGDHGMPGRSVVPPRDNFAVRVALWGDSQAEGVCVADSDKLHSRIERYNKHTIDVLPFARSGEDASHWLTQMPSVEAALAIDVHVLLVVDLPDLLAAKLAPIDFQGDVDALTARNKIAERTFAFVIQAFRYLTRDANDSPRRLRFRVGPYKDPQPIPSITKDVDWNAVWANAMETIAAASDRPIVIVYAPTSPTISHGNIQLHDPWNEQFQMMERAALRAGLTVLDVSDDFGDSARNGDWPHGFHNGQIGSGHLNATGYQVIARELNPVIARVRQ